MGYSGGPGGPGGSEARSSIAALVYAIARRKDLKEYGAAIDYVRDSSQHGNTGHYAEYTAYYQAQALYQGDPDAWEKWNKLQLRRLKQAQQPDGSIPGQQGPAYGTAMGRAGPGGQLSLSADLRTLGANDDANGFRIAVAHVLIGGVDALGVARHSVGGAASQRTARRGGPCRRARVHQRRRVAGRPGRFGAIRANWAGRPPPSARHFSSTRSCCISKKPNSPVRIAPPGKIAIIVSASPAATCCTEIWRA